MSSVLPRDMDTKDLIALAHAHLADVHSCEMRGLHIYLDSATREWFVVEDDDMAQLGRMIDPRRFELGPTAAELDHAYSVWCSSTPADEVNLEELAAGFGLSDLEDLEAAQDAASEAGDLLTYMVLRFLPDELSSRVEQNADIAGEAA